MRVKTTGWWGIILALLTLSISVALPPASGGAFARRGVAQSPVSPRSTSVRPLLERIGGIMRPHVAGGSDIVTNANDSGAGSLRDTVANANAGDTITFAPGVGVIALGSGPITIAKDLSIVSEGAAHTISGSGLSTVFVVATGATVTLADLIITSGQAQPGTGGGGILNNGTLTVVDSTIAGNKAGKGQDGAYGGGFGSKGGDGGGIVNTGALTVLRSTISGNTSGDGGRGGDGNQLCFFFCIGNPPGLGGDGGGGGGIANDGDAAQVTIVNSTIDNNMTGSGGHGGCQNACSGGGVGGSGGGIFSNGTLTITNSTVTGNKTGSKGNGCCPFDGQGAGLALGAGSLSLADTIVANNNTPSAPNDVACDAGFSITSHGYNLIKDVSAPDSRFVCSFTGNAGADITGQDPVLGSLRDNGGPTNTQMPGNGSPAIDAVPRAHCDVTTDQRGGERPDENEGSCDIGAVESGATVAKRLTGPGAVDLSSNSELYKSPCAGDPVDCASGVFSHSWTDLAIPGRGLALHFVRTYTSLNAAQDGPLGHGWTDSYDMHLTTDTSGTITVTEEGGTAVTFALSGTTYQPPSRVLATLAANGDGTLTFSRQDQTHYTFGTPTPTATGQLLSKTDRNGYTTTLGYTNGQLATITDPAGRALTLSYSGSRISRIVDPIGRAVSFTYNANGDLTDAADVRGNVTHFTYDPATHLLLTMTDPRGGVVSNVYDTSNRVVQQTDALNRTTTFTYTMDATGAQTTTIADPRGDRMVEAFQSNLLVARTRGYGTPQAATWTYTYDPTTLGMTGMTNPDGHTSRYTYDTNGNMTSETDPLSRTTRYAYDALNDTTAITDPLGVTTAMTYDVSGNLLQTARPLTQTGEMSATTLAYDPQHAGDLVARTDPNGHTERFTYDAHGDLTTASDALSETLSYRYDPVGRLLALTRPDGNVTGGTPISYTTAFTYDAVGDTTAITDALGHVLTHEYDADNNVITTTDVLGRQTVNGYDLANEKTSERRPDGGVYLTGYDSAGNATSQSDPLGHTTTYVYDPLNRLTAVTDPLGRTTVYAYDAAANPITTTDALGRSTISQYDAANERTGVTASDTGVSLATYDAGGRVISTTDALSRTTLYTYDSLNRRTAIVDPLGRVTTVGYDLDGNVITATDAMKRATVTTYDAVNRPTRVIRPDASTLSTAYDADGRVISTTDALSHTTLTAYDVLDQPVSTTDPLGHKTHYRYDSVGNRVAVIDPLAHATAYGYDALNRVITTTNALSRTTLATYDVAGNHTTTTDALGHTTVYGYDAANERTTVVQPDGSILGTGYDPTGNVISSTDALGRPTLYGYDTGGHVISTTDALSRTTLATYDVAGHRTTLTDPLGRTTSYGYNADDEPVTTTYSDGTTPNVSYTYYPSGQRRSMTDGTGTTTYGYDAIDRPITATTGAGRQVGYGYDLAGNLTGIIYPDGSVITRTYDAADRFTGVIDPRGRTTGFAYDAADNLITTTYPTTTTPITTALGYDAANEITGAATLSPRSTLLRFSYTRNALGQVTGGTDSIDGPAHQYAYNSLNQLTSDQQGTGAVTTTTGWSPDATGEITQTINGLRGYTATLMYDPAGELTSVRNTSPSTGTTTMYAYDGDGHRTGASTAIGGAGATYGWDQADRLVTATVTTPGGTRGATYSYDGDGLRTRKTVAGTGEDYTWDTSGSLPLLLQDNAARYIDGPDGLPVEMISGTTTLYLLHDQMGSTRGVVNGAGHLIASYAYDAYGNVKVHYGTLRSVPAPYYTPFLYAGQYTDAETGFQYLQARYYDPATAQFLSPDPLASMTNQPYAYTGGDPLNGSDPTGQCDVSVPFAGNVQVPGTSNNHYLCTDVAAYKALTALSNFNNSGLSNTVYKGVTDILQGAAACAGNIEACAQGTLLLTEYIGTHPGEALAAAAQAGISSLATFHDEIACGHYGTAAGHLLLAFVSTFGPGKVFDALKGAAAAGDAARASDGFFSRLAGRTADAVGCTPCFAAGTLVATPRGEQAIETLHAGDQVLAEDPQTKHVEAESLVGVRQNPATALVAVDLSDGSVITTTPTHAFWVDAGPGFAGPGWLYAEHLHPGDQLRTADGTRMFVVGTRRGVGTAVVYTLTVAKDHTFFVGPARVLVHNAVGCSSRTLGRNIAKYFVRSANTAAHHIVADSDPRAAPAVAILRRFGLDLNSADNGVFLPRYLSSPNPYANAVHSVIHTDRYYAAVNARLLMATSQYEARRILNSIATDLLLDQFPY